ncbi:glutathione S-transferase family protein [Pararhodobacter sp. CCB-MM2]|uniref:glutathione S-transferase family protein n=1 Tax=Pararhodobacter sp. CCB-MM2 TaxID=1786003 RepID=UPI000A635964|nr:glutathione S-transferase family protein [Pararhodobacter sp. CCB-MM2]
MASTIPTLFHSPNTRSSCVVALIAELGLTPGKDIDIRTVSVTRADGTGGPDPVNPHPEGKVPFLTHGAESLRERGAIMLYLTDLFPEAGLGPREGEAGRGDYLSWLFYYHSVVEPVVLLKMSGLDHPFFTAAIRDFATMIARLEETLSQGPWLLGDRFSAADLLISGPFLWLPTLLENSPVLRQWVEAVAARPSMTEVARRDAA